MINIMTFDIEEWYHSNLTDLKALAKFKIEDRVVDLTLRILDLLDETKNSATFFVLGDVAEKFPELALEIINRGHEVGSHGYRHNLVYNYTKAQFEEDIRRSVDVLGKAINRKILGYRAPSWSFNESTPWAWDVLNENGFQYDSSMYPFKTFLYGCNESPMFKYKKELQNGSTLTELPPSVIDFWGKRLPFSGGFFFRVSPLWYVNWCIRRINKLGNPAVIYLHPWEIDVEQPRVDVSAKDNFILYANLRKTEMKLRSLLKQHSFVSMKKYLSLDQQELSAKKETISS